MSVPQSKLLGMLFEQSMVCVLGANLGESDNAAYYTGMTLQSTTQSQRTL